MNAPWFAPPQAVAPPITAPPVTAPPVTGGREPPAGLRGRRRAARGGPSAAVLTVGLVAVALNLRIGVASVGPVLSSIRADLGLSATVASLLTTIPVVAFGAFAFLAPWLTRRLDMHQLLGLAMAALAAGIGMRRLPGVACLFAGTIVVGAAIAIANVVMPALIKRDFPDRVGAWMSVYSTSLFLSAAIADGLTVPLLPLAGGDWRPALALWTFPAVVACLLWLPQFFRAPDQAGPQAPGAAGPAGAAEAARPTGMAGAAGTARATGTVGPSFRAVLTDPVAIAVAAFMGVQSIGYYVTLTWLPTLLQDHGMDPHAAGWMLSFSAFPGIAAALVSPALARRIRPAWAMIVISVLCYGAAYAGLAVAPLRAPYLWMTLLGLGQGASISLSLSYMAWRSPDARHTAQVSTMAQGFGYLMASLGPIGIGAVHAASGSWTVPLAVLAALLVPQLIAGVLASRERQVLAAREKPVPRQAVPRQAMAGEPTRAGQSAAGQPGGGSGSAGGGEAMRTAEPLRAAGPPGTAGPGRAPWEPAPWEEAAYEPAVPSREATREQGVQQEEGRDWFTPARGPRPPRSPRSPFSQSPYPRDGWPAVEGERPGG
jgi:CP family cyanate transporter-like MFS transporter